MRNFTTSLFGVRAYVTYSYTNAEQADETSPGCASEAEIESVVLEQDDDRIRLGIYDIPDGVIEVLQREAIEDAESDEP